MLGMYVISADLKTHIMGSSPVQLKCLLRYSVTAFGFPNLQNIFLRFYLRKYLSAKSIVMDQWSIRCSGNIWMVIPSCTTEKLVLWPSGFFATVRFFDGSQKPLHTWFIWSEDAMWIWNPVVLSTVWTVHGRFSRWNLQESLRKPFESSPKNK